MQLAPGPHAARRTTVRRAEHGLTIVELMVVMFIMAIIMALAVQSTRGSRNTGGRLEMKGVALRYADAVERFQADHGRRVPSFGTPTWPSADAQLGPRTVVTLASGSTTKYYIKQPIPEILDKDGPLDAEIVGGGAPAGEGGTLVYDRRTAYEFTVSAYRNGELLCVAGDVEAGDPPC